MTIQEGYEINKKFLDEIDFIPYFIHYNDKVLGDIMSIIETDYHDSLIEMPPELEGYVFNYYSVDDFRDYLKKRYDNLTIYPVEDYYVEVLSWEENK